MDAKQACLRPLKAAHSCVGSALVATIPKQSTKRIQPEPRRQDRALLYFVFSGFSFASISLCCLCAAPVLSSQAL